MAGIGEAGKMGRALATYLTYDKHVERAKSDKRRATSPVGIRYASELDRYFEN
jgi:hypothetical protein